MKFIFTNLLFGSLLILWGASLIIKTFSGSSISIVKIGFALIMISIGFLLIKEIYSQRKNNTAKYKKCEVVLGCKKIIDLSTISSSDENPRHIKIYTLLGKVKVKLNPEIPTIIHARPILSCVNLPANKINSCDGYTYESHIKSEKARIIIDTTTLLGTFEAKNK